MINADLLKDLPPAEAERVLALGQRMLLTTGAELFHLGDAADSIYLVVRGRIRLTLPMQVRSREEDILVEERTIRPDRWMVGLDPALPVHPDRHGAARNRGDRASPAKRSTRYFAAHPDTGYAVSLNLASVIGQRLQLFQAMWLREVQRMVELRCA